MIELNEESLRADGINLRLYTSLNPLWTLEPSVYTPYIPHTETPQITWSYSTDSISQLLFRLQFIWIGLNGLVENELDTGFIIRNNFYRIGNYQRLKHTSALDSGGYYRTVLSSQQDNTVQSIGGIFKINYRPSRPINLTVS